MGTSSSKPVSGTEIYIWGNGIFRKPTRILQNESKLNPVKLVLGKQLVAIIDKSGDLVLTDYESWRPSTSENKENEAQNHQDVAKFVKRIKLNKAIVDAAFTSSSSGADSLVAIGKDGSVIQVDVNAASDDKVTHEVLRQGALKAFHAASISCSQTHCAAVGSKGNVVSWITMPQQISGPAFDHSQDENDILNVVFPSLGRGFIDDPESGGLIKAREPKNMVLETGVRIKQVSCGQMHTALVDSAGQLWVCGRDLYGNLGMAAEVWRSTNDVASGAGRTSGMSLSSSGALTFRGFVPPSSGMIARSKTVAVYWTPVRSVHPLFQAGTVRSVQCGQSHTMVQLKDGRVVSFGFNQYGSCGHHNFAHLAKVSVVDGLTNVAAGITTRACTISATGSGDHSLVMLETSSSDRALYSFGLNRDGQLGNGTLQSSSKPQEVVSAGLAKHIAVGPASSGYIA